MRSSFFPALIPLLALAVAACADKTSGDPGGTAAPSGSDLPVASASSEAPAPSASASAPKPVDPTWLDPMAGHRTTKEGLLALFTIQHPGKNPKFDGDAFIDKTFGPEAGKANQGNIALSKHFISKAKCMEGLEGTVLQTPEQRALCGADYMVPFYKDGDVGKAKACIDVFEFPNQPCELPIVWIGPTQAKQVCELQGKRLCAQDEWMLACAGDPAGGPEQKYSYGDELDLEACNTNKPAGTYGPNCNPQKTETTWKTCATNTEPSGAFPRCRSRFGVYDLQGNVAEEMSRWDAADAETKDQLKGSAFFYVDVARDEFGRAPKGKPAIKPERMRGTYPDICRHDPRWHVESLKRAWHVNYHLGFRCCKDVAQER